MAHEIETKVLDIDAEAIKTRLSSLGAKKIQDTRLIVDWYRPKGEKSGEEIGNLILISIQVCLHLWR
jgi:phosphoribosylformylglycinamidine (FGAM) synthase PurS component